MKRIICIAVVIIAFSFVSSCAPKKVDEPVAKPSGVFQAKEHQVSTVLTGFKPNLANPDYKLEGVYVKKIQEGHYVLCGKLYGPGMEGDPGAWHIVGEEKVTHVESISSSAATASRWPQSKQLSITDDAVQELWYYVKHQ